MAHEMMHALGFYHEQSRPDREKYVYVFMKNVKDGKGNNFQIQAGPRYDHYDFNSVMHYGEYAFRNKEWGGIASQATRTLYPNPLSMQKENFGKGVTIGQRIGLSFCDELKLRRFYAEPGIRGRKQCDLWSPRTCKCRDYEGGPPEGFNETLCTILIDQYDKENPPTHVQ